MGEIAGLMACPVAAHTPTAIAGELAGFVVDVMKRITGLSCSGSQRRYAHHTVTTLQPLLRIAIDLTASMADGDRLQRLLDAVRAALPCDAAAVLELTGDVLLPRAVHGLAPEVMGRRFAPAEHPRLAQILGAAQPVRFAADCPLPDPYDGLVSSNPDATRAVHSCLGVPLVRAGQVIGILTVDALEPGAFDGLDEELLCMLGALAGAALVTGRLLDALEASSRRHRLLARELQRESVVDERSGPLLGLTPAIQRVRDDVQLVAASPFAVLVTGETGVGKELVARSIHWSSPRRDEPLIYVNCAALPESIIESELFGHVRGAFTGASNDRAGKLEIAHRGTLFLDEVGELPLTAQPKLLRALQEGEIQKVGADRPLHVDVRVVAATNRDLESEVAAGRFRADLYHRLAMFPIHVPPLRERREDIALLAGHFLDQTRRRLGLGPVRLTEASRQWLHAGEWPGNVRELDHVLGRAVLRASMGVERGLPVVVQPVHLGANLPSAGAASPPPRDGAPTAVRLHDAVEETKRTLIRRAVAEHDGNWAAAARALGMARGNLHHMARRLGLLEPERRR